MKLVSLVFPFLIFIMLSCSDSDEGLDRYDVVIAGFNTSFDNNNLENIDFVASKPTIFKGVVGLNVTVQNKTHSYVDPIEIDFNLTPSEGEYNNLLIKSVTEGNNLFIAEASENSPIRGWVDIDIQRPAEMNLFTKEEVEILSQKYGEYLKTEYPEYKIYKDTIETYIGSKNDVNEVDFHMKLVNARLAVVIENLIDEATSTYSYIEVKIDGGNKIRVDKGTAVCYIVNDEEFEETIKLEIYTYRKKYPDFVDRREYSLERGKNKTRLITII